MKYDALKFWWMMARLQHSAHSLMDRFGANPIALKQLQKLREEVAEVETAIRYESRENQIAEMVDVLVTWWNSARALEITPDELMHAMELVIAKNDAKNEQTHHLNPITGWITRNE